MDASILIIYQNQGNAILILGSATFIYMFLIFQLTKNIKSVIKCFQPENILHFF